MATDPFADIFAAPSGSVRPSAADPFADIFASPGEETVLGEIPKGLKAGVQQIRGMGYGLAALAGQALGSEGLTDYAREGLADVERKTPKPAVGSFSDIRGVEDAAKYIAYGVSSNLPNMALSFGGGAAGMAAAKKLVGAAAKRAAEAAIAGGAAPEVAAKVGTDLLDKAIKGGAITGAGLSSIGMETGSIAQDQLTETGQVEPLRAIAGGIPAGLLDVVPEWYLAKRLGWVGKGAADFKGGRLTRAAKVAGQQFAMEAPTEAAQTYIERMAVPGKSVTNAEAWDEIINSFILGGLTGGLVGGAGGVFTKASKAGAGRNAPASEETPAGGPETPTPGAPPPTGTEPGPPAPVRGKQRLTPEYFRDLNEALKTGIGPDGKPFTLDDARGILEAYRKSPKADPVSVKAFETILGQQAQADVPETADRRIAERPAAGTDPFAGIFTEETRPEAIPAAGPQTAAATPAELQPAAAGPAVGQHSAAIRQAAQAAPLPAVAMPAPQPLTTEQAISGFHEFLKTGPAIEAVIRMKDAVLGAHPQLSDDIYKAIIDYQGSKLENPAPAQPETPMTGGMVAAAAGMPPAVSAGPAMAQARTQAAIAPVPEVQPGASTATPSPTGPFADIFTAPAANVQEAPAVPVAAPVASDPFADIFAGPATAESRTAPAETPAAGPSVNRTNVPHETVPQPRTRAFIENRIRQLGTVEAVNRAYSGNDLVSDYARTMAPKILGVEPSHVTSQETAEIVPPAKEARTDLLPEGWKMEIGQTRTKEGHTAEAEVDWRGKRIVFSNIRYMADPKIVNHEIAHVVIESMPDNSRLLTDYARAKQGEWTKKGYDPSWVVKNHFHREEIAIDYGNYLNGKRVPASIRDIFQKYLEEPASSVDVGTLAAPGENFTDVTGENPAPPGTAAPKPPATATPGRRSVKPRTKKNVAARERLRDFYAPGNVVYDDYWKKYDKVLDFKEEENGLWKVLVQRSDEKGNPAPGSEPRWHATAPTKGDKVVSRDERGIAPGPREQYSVEERRAIDELFNLRHARGSDQAKKAARQFLNKPLKNNETGITATVSGESLSKMLSGSAVKLSVSPYAHMQAVANIDKLFPAAIHRESRLDRKGMPAMRSLHHFDVPMIYEHEVLRVKILAKEYARQEQGTRLYLVKAVEIGKPASVKGEPTSPKAAPVSRPPASFDDRFARLVDLVKWKAEHPEERYASETPSAKLTDWSLEDVKRIFKGREVIQVPGPVAPRIMIKMPDGGYLTVESVFHISPDEVDMDLSYARKFNPEEEIITGAYGKRRIRLVTGFASRWTLHHESAHALEGLGFINSADVAVLRGHIKRMVRERKIDPVNPNDIGGAEDRANFIADALTAGKPPRGAVGRVIDRIRDFLDRLMEAFGVRTAGAVVRDIESGRIFKREGKPAEGREAYAVGQRLREADIPVDNVVPVKMKTSGSVADILMMAAKEFSSWPASITAADGSEILLHHPERGSMAVGVKHLIWDNEKDILHPEKARWLPNVPGTLENAAVRLVDARSGNRIYVRQYADKTKHMVVVDPAGKVEDQKPFRGGLVTQFPYAGEGHQDSMMIDWERVKGEGSLQGGPNPSRPASAVPGPRQEEFRHDDMTSDREVKERYGVEPLRNPADTDRRRLSNRENPTAHETGVAEAPGSRKRYSRRSGEEKYPGPPLSREALERYAMQLMGNARNKPELVVVEKVSDLPFEAPEDAKGALRRDVMYLVSEQISGAEDANEVVLHEFVGHFGLRGFFGSSLDGALHAIHENNPPVKQYAVEWRLSNKDFQGRTGMSDAGYYYRSIEEAMARMAQENKPFNSARRLLSTVRSLLRKIGLTRVADTLEAKSNTEALTMLHKAKLYIRKGMTAGSKIPEPLYPYFVAVRHGSPHKLDKFSTSRIGPGEGTQANGYGLHLAAGHAGLSAWNPEDVQRIFKGRPSWHTTSRLSASFGHAFNSRGDFDARGHACSR